MIIWRYSALYPDDYQALPSTCTEKANDPTLGKTEELRVEVMGSSCGMGSIYGLGDDGLVTVKDSSAGGFLLERTADELDGITGFATLMNTSQNEYEDCEWIITWINWFQERQFMQDWYVRDLDIVEEKANAYVWNWCKLPDEITTGVDCESDLQIYGEE